MKKLFFIIICVCCLPSCTTKKQIMYFDNVSELDNSKIIFAKQTIQPHDILKIDVQSANYNAAAPYNKSNSFNISQNISIESLKLDGYAVSKDFKIRFPILGEISVKDMDPIEIENDIRDRLVSGNHLISPIVSVRLVNATFTVLGEVRRPGTFSFIGERISLLQALGYAGDLTIEAERSKVLLIREVNDIRETHEIDLRDINTVNNPIYYIKTNDIILVRPNFNKVKSAGFIGNPSSIASLASLLLSITLLLINN